ncbi:hypothetical protein [Flavobacterium tructae]|jgi:hypothetical protein|uniref:Uncharacterized protein n=1 Tax=Flavobacterium tructae TaxID=1114873 RepID=A0A1S1J2D7_9FLAO|nr:hypothetical protein [Flavobacterium tructae]OHT43948.1 hypothetical protein BHE19_16565 [Flavobacterium tructae]OXB21537.1 hypothetical protein B0A71_03255 [Flavobacterium tructae]
MKFPTLKENEFAVLMAHCETGIVLDVNFNTYQNNVVNQNTYSVFADIQQTKEFINRISEEHDKIEFIIYNSKQELYEFVKARFMQ